MLVASRPGSSVDEEDSSVKGIVLFEENLVFLVFFEVWRARFLADSRICKSDCDVPKPGF